MKLTKILSLLLAAAMLLVAAGCGKSENPPPSSQGAESSAAETAKLLLNIIDLQAAPLLAPDYGNPDENAAKAAKGANEFAFRLAAELLKEKQDENFVFSPVSVWLPLAALVNATDEANRPALLEALGAAGLSADDVNRAASLALYDFLNEGAKDYPDTYHNPLKIANAIFVDSGEKLRQDFAQKFLDYYRGQSIEADFRSPEAVKAVNDWAAEHTEGLIPEIVESFDPDAVAAIASAIYFSDRWSWEFDPAETKTEVFHAPGGDMYANMMLHDGMQNYYEDDTLQAVRMGFKTGGGMLVLLPKTGSAADILSGMNQETLDKILGGAMPSDGRLLLPRFSIDSGIMKLRDVLEALSVPLFDRQSAPLTGGIIEGDKPVWVGEAVQKAVIEVDEKGTTAAAVTVMEMATTAAFEPAGSFEMVCDKPFAFVLYEYAAGTPQVLFTGVVNAPEAAPAPADGEAASSIPESAPAMEQAAAAAGEFLRVHVQDKNGKPVPFVSGGLEVTVGDAVGYAPLASKDNSITYSDANGDLFKAINPDDRHFVSGEFDLHLFSHYDNEVKQSQKVTLPAPSNTITVIWEQPMPPTERPAQTTGLRLRVVDSAGKPVAGVELGGSPYPKETEGPIPDIAIILGPSDANGYIRWDSAEHGTYELYGSKGAESQKFTIKFPSGKAFEELTLTWNPKG